MRHAVGWEVTVRWGMVLLLAGCAAGSGVGSGVGPAVPVVSDQCGVALAAGLVGQPFVTLADVALPGPLRVLYPGQMVMAEVQPARLNAAVDGAARITGVFCG